MLIYLKFKLSYPENGASETKKEGSSGRNCIEYCLGHYGTVKSTNLKIVFNIERLLDQRHV